MELPASRQFASLSHRSISNPGCVEGLCASLQVVNDFQIYSQITPTDNRLGYEISVVAKKGVCYNVTR